MIRLHDSDNRTRYLQFWRDTLNPEEIEQNGQRLFQSAKNLRQAAPDLDALLKSLWKFITKDGFGGEVTDLGDECADYQDWIKPAYAYNGAVSLPPPAPRQKPAQVGTISMILRLCNSSDVDEDVPDWPWLDQACLILGWFRSDNSEQTWTIADFDPNGENQAPIKHVGNGLWAWKEAEAEKNPDEYDPAYFFVIPIFALRDEAALKKFALAPLKKLFEADTPSDVANTALCDVPALVPNA